MVTANDVLRFLADLAPVGSTRDQGPAWDVRANGPVVVSTLVAGPPGRQPSRGRVDDPVAAEDLDPGGSFVPVLQPTDTWRKTVVLHGEQEVGRRSRLSLVGRGRVPGGIRTVVAPLLSAVVGPGPRFGAGTSPVAPPTDEAGDPTVLATALDLDEDLLLRAAVTAPSCGPVHEPLLEAMPRLRAVRDQLRGAGVGVDGVVVGGAGNALVSHRLWLCLGDLRFVEPPDDEPPRVESLRSWAALPADTLATTALGALYDRRESSAPTAGEEPPGELVDEPRSPLPLTRAQREVVTSARTAPLSVVSGAPGTGKSHVAVAVALDEVARGGSVLLATRSGHAADVLAGLFARQPGPAPVRFGRGTSRRALAEQLAEGLPPPPARAEVQAAVAGEERAAAGLRDATDVLGALLAVVGGGADPATEAVLRTDVPGAFDGSVDPAAASRDLDRASRDDTWWERVVAPRAARRLRRLTRAAPQVPLDRIGEALALARVRRLAATLESEGQLRLGPARERVETAASELRDAVGRRLDVTTLGAPTRASRRAVAGLAAALRAGPARRAALLARIDGAAMTSAMPLWIGTVGEVERLLPRTRGLFDLVVLDEASQLDQLVAAPVLARASRAVVVGDPRQLRHVSFVADLDVDEALERHGLDGLASLLDVRRVSAFDAAVAAAPVRWLDLHLRSSPHLIQFSARRFYEQHLHLATAHPSNATRDAIDTVHVVGTLGGGVVAAEIGAVLETVRQLAASEDAGSTVGVVTPFRDQADALEAALLAEVDLATMEALALRVGTVHAFQGSERDVVIVSLGVAPDGPPQRRRFASDPHLLNVMVTRARERIVVVTSLPAAGGDGLVGEYLAYAERPPGESDRPPPGDPWTRALLVELQRNGLDARAGASAGAHGVDLVVGAGRDAVGLLTVPHADGILADLDRWTLLRRAGWRLREEYATPTDQDAVGRALLLRAELS